MSLIHVVICIALFVIYFFPSIIASSRGHKNQEAIKAVNIFLGWTLVGWVVAFVWSLTYQEPAEKPKPTDKQSGQSMLQAAMETDPNLSFGDVMAGKRPSNPEQQGLSKRLVSFLCD